MLFSKDNEHFIGVFEKTFTKAIDAAAERLKIEKGHKIYHKINDVDTAMCFVYRGK